MIARCGAYGIRGLWFCRGAVSFASVVVSTRRNDPASHTHRISPRMRILLARHGETPWNAEGRYQGQIDIPLSPTGEAQATALGTRLRNVEITRAVASPLSRARHTAELALGEARKPMLTTDIDLQEIAHGEWEGLLASEINDKDPARLRAWREQPETVLMPGGESLQQVLDRSWPGLARATEGLGTGDTLLVVAHDAVNRVILCRILGLPLSKLWSFRQAPTTLNLLEGPDVDNLEVVRLNDCAHHTPFFGEAVHRAL
jgi:probable phosphoglycerate mutase